MSAQNWVTLFAAIIVGVPTIVVGLATVRQNRRGAQTTSALETGKLDLARFEAFEKRSDEALARSDRRIDELEEQLATEKSAREQAEKRAAAAEVRAAAAERRTSEAVERAGRAESRVAELERRIAHLERTETA